VPGLDVEQQQRLGLARGLEVAVDDLGVLADAVLAVVAGAAAAIVASSSMTGSTGRVLRS
jgi:hypothetical protein